MKPHVESPIQPAGIHSQQAPLLLGFPDLKGSNTLDFPSSSTDIASCQVSPEQVVSSHDVEHTILPVLDSASAAGGHVSGTATVQHDASPQSEKSGMLSHDTAYAPRKGYVIIKDCSIIQDMICVLKESFPIIELYLVVVSRSTGGDSYFRNGVDRIKKNVAPVSKKRNEGSRIALGDPSARAF